MIIVLQQKRINEISFTISHFVSQSQLKENTPSGYFLFHNKPVLLYTGLEALFNISEDYENTLYKLTKNRLIDDINTSTVVISHPEAWTVRIKGNSVLINKTNKSSDYIKIRCKSPKKFKKVLIR